MLHVVFTVSCGSGSCRWGAGFMVHGVADAAWGSGFNEALEMLEALRACSKPNAKRWRRPCLACPSSPVIPMRRQPLGSLRLQ